MALLLLILLLTIGVFLFYYELVWKKFEKEQGKSLVELAADFAFSDKLVEVSLAKEKEGAANNPWDDWKYRLMVELHRRGQMNPKEGAELVGVSLKEVENYFDALDAEGKVQSAGDSERGVFYRIVSEA